MTYDELDVIDEPKRRIIGKIIFYYALCILVSITIGAVYGSYLTAEYIEKMGPVETRLNSIRANRNGQTFALDTWGRYPYYFGAAGLGIAAWLHFVHLYLYQTINNKADDEYDTIGVFNYVYEKLFRIYRDMNTVSVVAAIAVGIAMLKLPYWYYNALRILITFTCAHYIFKMVRASQQSYHVFLLGFIAMIYNPILPVHLQKETWYIINAITLLYFVWFTFSKIRPSRQP